MYIKSGKATWQKIIINNLNVSWPINTSNPSENITFLRQKVRGKLAVYQVNAYV